MSSSASGGSDASIYIFLGVMILVVIRRMRMVFLGSKVSKTRGLIFSLYYIAFASFLIAGSVVAGAATAQTS